MWLRNDSNDTERTVFVNLQTLSKADSVIHRDDRCVLKRHYIRESRQFFGG